MTKSKSCTVVHIIDRLNVGGPTKYVTWLAALLPEFRSYVVTGTIGFGEGDMSWFATQSGVSPIVVAELSRELSIRDIVAFFKILLLLFKIKPDIVHTHKSKGGAIGRAATFVYRALTRRKCRTVHVFHGHIFHSYYGRFKTWVFLSIERILALWSTDIILTISEQQKIEISEKYKVGLERQHKIIPYGLDFATSSGPSLYELLGLQPRTPIIGIVGRICEVKNQEMFILVAKALKPKHGELKFAVIGDGHLRHNCESLVAQNSLGDTVLFTGFRDDVMNFYRDLTIISITSNNEGTPFTMIEAMKFGVPAVATNVGGVIDLMGKPLELPNLPEGVSGWTHGLTVEPNDVKAYSEAINYLVSNNRIRIEMGIQASKFIESRYSCDRFLKDMSEMYQTLLGN